MFLDGSPAYQETTNARMKYPLSLLWLITDS